MLLPHVYKHLHSFPLAIIINCITIRIITLGNSYKDGIYNEFRGAGSFTSAYDLRWCNK